MKGKNLSFISWFCYLLKEQQVSENEFIFTEEEELSNIFFLFSKNKKCSFVLPKYNNLAYININTGELFGLIDLIACSMEHGFQIEEWQKNKMYLKQYFSIIAF